MEDLVFKSKKGNPVTTSLLVAIKFEKEHKNVLQAIRELIRTAENPAVNLMFYESTYFNAQNKTQPLFIMNQDGFTILAMRFTGAKAMKFQLDYIKAFNGMREQLKQLVQLPNFNNPAEAARAWADEHEKNELSEQKIKVLAPKADFADRVIYSDHLVDIGQAAKLLKLGYGRNTFFKRLKADKIFFSSRNEPKQQYINQKYFEYNEITVPNGSRDKTVMKTFVTQKGLFWLSKKYDGEFKPGFPALNVE